MPESGAACNPGDTVTANYKGSLLSDGSVFDENQNGSFNFALGQGRVIKCWETAFAQMKVGEKATITCPPEMAYGSKGAGGVIPPNAALQFDVETVNCVAKEAEVSATVDDGEPDLY